MPPNDLQWIEIADFKSGIKSRTAPSTTSAPAGRATPVADRNGTYRCWALPNGSLAGLPKRTFTFTPTYPVNPNLCATGRLTISGFHVALLMLFGEEAHIAYEGVRTATSRRFYYWTRVQNWGTVDTLFSADPTTAVSVITNGTFPTSFHSFRADASDPAALGIPCVVASWREPGPGTLKFWKIFPDPSTPTSNTPGNISTTIVPVNGFNHQGRAVVFNEALVNHGASTTWVDNEQTFFTQVNTKVVANTVAQVFSSNNSGGYSSAFSSSFSELFLVKQTGGAYLIRGDLSDPTVLQLPSVAAGGGTGSVPTNSPIGVCYMNAAGAWLWNGGEQAEPISYDALTGSDFSIANSDIGPRYYGRAYYWYDWVFFPNNWVWNWRDQSWWRLENPSDVQLHWMGPSAGVTNDRLYATPAYVASTSDPAVYGYDYFTPADTYKYTTLPIPTGTDRDIVIRELVLVGTGDGTVVVTFTKFDGSTEVHNFTFSSTTTPQTFRHNANVRCTDIKFVIDATKTGATPVVHNMRLGVDMARTHYPNV